MSGGAFEALIAAGMSEASARAKSRLFESIDSELGSARSENRPAWFVPGRIEVVGKHTDYAGGRSLLCAAERGFSVGAVPRDDAMLRVVDMQSGDRCELALSADLGITGGGWTVYPAAVARRVARNFPGPLRGADVAFASDLPMAAGMSSSSALVVAIFTVLSAVNGLAARDQYRASIDTDHDLAAYLACVENGRTYKSLEGSGGVGTFGGSEDHTALLSARAGQLAQYSFCPTRLERSIALPADCVFAIACSGIVAEKTGAARASYNRASEAVAAILDAWREASGSDAQSLAEAATRSPDAPDRIRDLLRSRGADSTWLLNRFEQFWRESEEIVPRATDALARGELARFGALVDESQSAAETLLGNQVAETVWLAREARSLGALAASAFGAGFGGSVWALVHTGGVEAFVDRWRDAYRRSGHGAANAAEFFVTAAGPSMLRV